MPLWRRASISGVTGLEGFARRGPTVCKTREREKKGLEHIFSTFDSENAFFAVFDIQN